MPAGRKSGVTKWLTDDSLLRIKGWARDGLTDKEIAIYKMGVSETTLSRWKSENPEIVQALKEGREPVDVEVEDCLSKSAKGFKITVRKPIKLRTVKEKDGMKLTEERIEYVDEEQYIPPQTVAQIFWLKNRKPDYWRDKPVKENTEESDRLAKKLGEILDGVESVIE